MILQDGVRRMLHEQEDCYYYVTVMNENYAHPDMPKGAEADIIKGMYLFRDGDNPLPAGSPTRGSPDKPARATCRRPTAAAARNKASAKETVKPARKIRAGEERQAVASRACNCSAPARSCAK